MFSGVFQRTLLASRKDLKSSLQQGWTSWIAAAPPTTSAPGGPTTVAIRSKHSNTVKKRLFTHNPARKRILKKLGIVPRFEELPERQFKKVHSFKYLPNTWTEPAATRPEYPFSVKRTKNKPFDAIGFLPVYTKFRYACEWLLIFMPRARIICIHSSLFPLQQRQYQGYHTNQKGIRWPWSFHLWITKCCWFSQTTESK